MLYNSSSRWLLLLAFSVPAFASSLTKIETRSSTLDPISHFLNAIFFNKSEKKIVAYVVEVRQFDHSGKQIGDPLTVGTDNVMNLIYGEDQPSLVSPGAEFNQQFTLQPEALTANASVIAVIYLDRTAEGDPKQIANLFKNRAMHAQHAAAALEVLQSEAPTSDTETQSLKSQLSSIRERTGAVEQLLHSAGTPTQAQWNTAAAQEKALSDVLALQSKEAAK